jgi:hypothetical protein
VTGPRLELMAPSHEPVIIFRRAFEAPAWLVSCEVDLRVGGGYRFVHRAPDGSQHVFYGRYLEIERPTRLVSTFAYEAAPETEALDEVTFDQDGGTTLVTGRSVFPTFGRVRSTSPGARRAGWPDPTSASMRCSARSCRDYREGKDDEKADRVDPRRPRRAD